MKATLEFDLPMEQEEFDAACKATKYKAALDEVWDKLFRPRHKHGYCDERFNALVEDEKVQQVLDVLEDMYRGVCNEWLRDDEL